MPNKQWRGNIVSTADFFARELTASAPAVMSVLLRIGLTYLFFWYVFDFIYELGYEYLRFAIWVGISALLVLALLSFKLINSWKKFDLDKEVAASSLVPFVLLNSIPIAAVAVATWYGHNFGWGLLRFTQYSLRRFASWL